MCGIVGIVPIAVKESVIADPRIREASMRLLSTQLLLNIESRGKDASGFSAMFENGTWLMLKQPVAADEFTKNVGQTKYSDQEDDANYRNMYRTWQQMAESESATTIYMGHARKGTKGSEYNTENNHPIAIENGTEGVHIVGVHNGKIENDKEIFDIHSDNIKRAGEVDSEAIFQMQKLYFGNVAPTTDVMSNLDQYLRGTYAILTMNNKFPSVLGLLRRSRPLEIVTVKAGLDFIILSSTKIALEDSIEEYNRYVSALGDTLLPFICDSDVDNCSFLDDTAGCIDASTEVSAIEDCLTDNKLEYPRTAESKNANYDITTRGYNNFNSKITLVTKAVVTNGTAYETTGKLTDNSKGQRVVKLSHEELDIRTVTEGSDLVDGDDENSGYGGKEAAVLGKSLDNVISKLNNVLEFQELDLLSLDSDADVIMTEVSSKCPDALWISSVTNENACIKTDLTLQPSKADIKEATEEIHALGFSDGYTFGRLIAKEEAELGESLEQGTTIENLTTRLENMRKRSAKSAAVIANLKAFSMALIATSQWIEIDNKIGTFLVSEGISTIAKGISKKFSIQKALDIISASTSDVETVVNITEAYNGCNEYLLEDSDEVEDETKKDEVETFEVSENGQ